MKRCGPPPLALNLQRQLNEDLKDEIQTHKTVAAAAQAERRRVEEALLAATQRVAKAEAERDVAAQELRRGAAAGGDAGRAEVAMLRGQLNSSVGGRGGGV